jgi:hypothetical protein
VIRWLGAAVVVVSVSGCASTAPGNDCRASCDEAFPHWAEVTSGATAACEAEGGEQCELTTAELCDVFGGRSDGGACSVFETCLERCY